MRIPKINKTAVCIADNPVFAGVISSYFSEEGAYFSVFQFHEIDRPPENLFSKISTETLRVHILNRISKLQPSFIILAGLNECQINLLNLPKNWNVVDIRSLDKANEILASLITTPSSTIFCKTIDVCKGLVQAKNLSSKLEIDDQAGEIVATTKSDVGLFVVEEENDISAICTINLAHASGSSVEFIKQIPKYKQEDIKKNIEELKQSFVSDEQENAVLLANQLKEIESAITDIDFSKYKWATFLTHGIPYSLVLNRILPTALLPRSPAPHLIIDTLIKNQQGHYLNSALIFSVPLSKGRAREKTYPIQDESPKLSQLLHESGYLVISLVNESATKKNFGEFTAYFPYELLHISSHGGGMKDGMFRRKILKGSDGSIYKFDYYHVADFEVVDKLDENGERMIGVTSMYIPRALNGRAWGSEELSETFSKEQESLIVDHLTSLSLSQDAGDFSLPLDYTDSPARVPHTKWIDCIDNIHQGQFHSLASMGEPFIFNNSCNSWYEMGTSFLGVGARAYIGTLWKIDNAVAKTSAENFYEMTLKNERDLMTSCHIMNKEIEVKKYKDIYVYWGLPWSYIKPSTEPTALVIKKVVDRMRQMAQSYSEKAVLSHQDNDEEMTNKINDIISFLRDKIQQIPARYWASVEERYSSGLKIFIKKSSYKNNVK